MYITINKDVEIWKPLIYKNIIPDMYLISNYGQIKRIHDDYLVHQLLYGENKYCMVSLRTSDGNRTFSPHRLTAWTYVEGYDEDTGCMIVNHKDVDKLNNYYENLEWTTYWNNTKHGILHGNIIGTTRENGGKLIYTVEFIESICELLRDNIKAKTICELLKIPDDIIKPVKSLIKDIKGERTHVDISSIYGIKATPRNLFPIPEVHAICQLIVDGYTDDEIYSILDVSDEELPKYKKVLFNITHKYSFVKIYDSYGLVKRERVTNKYDDELIHSICKLLELLYSTDNIITTLKLDNMNMIKSLIYDIRTRHSHTKISKLYKW